MEEYSEPRTEFLRRHYDLFIDQVRRENPSLTRTILLDLDERHGMDEVLNFVARLEELPRREHQSVERIRHFLGDRIDASLRRAVHTRWEGGMHRRAALGMMVFIAGSIAATAIEDPEALKKTGQIAAASSLIFVALDVIATGQQWNEKVSNAVHALCSEGDAVIMPLAEKLAGTRGRGA